MLRNKRLLLIILQVFAGMLVACSAQIGCQGNTDCQNGVEEQTLFNSETIEDKRKFNPWGGKRAVPVFSAYDEIQSDESKRSFSPWAGKRGAAQPDMGYVIRTRDARPDKMKRKFHPWHGKRSGMALRPEIPESLLKQMVLEYPDLDNDKPSDKRGFSPWAGK